MSRVKHFLENLNNAELAFLYKYKYPTYLDDNQATIREELNKRELDDVTIKRFIRDIEFNPKNTGCQRCNSQQNISQQIEFTNTNKYTGLDGLSGRANYTSRVECAVCGYLLYDGNAKGDNISFWDLLWRVIFRKYK